MLVALSAVRRARRSSTPGTLPPASATCQSKTCAFVRLRRFAVRVPPRNSLVEVWGPVLEPFRRTLPTLGLQGSDLLSRGYFVFGVKPTCQCKPTSHFDDSAVARNEYVTGQSELGHASSDSSAESHYARDGCGVPFAR